MELTHQFIFLGALLLLVSILASVVTTRIGIPLLLIFLILGMLAGEDGPGGILFNNFHAAHLIGSLALAIILFDGGLRTKAKTFKAGFYPALSLATVGVVVTAVITGLSAAWLLHLHWFHGLLIGAIVAPTDVAAVFAILQLNRIGLPTKVTATIEIESGTNDPMAIFLTITLTQLIASGNNNFNLNVISQFFIQMGLGTGLGLAGGYMLVKLVNRLGLSKVFYPLLVMAGGMLIYAFSTIVGGNGFLSIYLAGLVIGNSQLKAAHYIFGVHNGLAWLSQISMFLMLGLLVTPSELIPHMRPALMIALILIFIARPIAVALSLLPFKFNWREQVFISWVGLRGAVPIILALFPKLAGLDGAQIYFNVAFFVVLISLILQGWTVSPVAKYLKLARLKNTTVTKHITLPDSSYELLMYHVAADAAVLNFKPLQLTLPDGVQLTAIMRDKIMMNPKHVAEFKPGDGVYLICSSHQLSALDELFKAG